MNKKPFSLTEKQKEAQALIARTRNTMLYGGSRSGKTFLVVRAIIIRALATPSTHLIARRAQVHVRQSIFMKTFPDVMEMCFPGLEYEKNNTYMYVELPTAKGGYSRIWFSGLDDKARVDKILGNEYSTIFVNEVAKRQVSWETIETLETRLAETSGLPLRFIVDCNPFSKKEWAYTVYTQKRFEDGMPLPLPDDYQAIQMNPKDNAANLDKTYLKSLEFSSHTKKKRFFDGEFVDDIEGALWSASMIAAANARKPGEILQTVVAVDPAVTERKDSDLTGIVIVSSDDQGGAIVHADLSLKASPNKWAQTAINAYHHYSATAIVVEVNQGGDMVKTIIKSLDPSVRVVEVRASKGKFARAEPVAALYEGGEFNKIKVSHIGDDLRDLEAEMMEYVPEVLQKSPDRLDALVWAITHLLLNKSVGPRATRLF